MNNNLMKFLSVFAIIVILFALLIVIGTYLGIVWFFVSLLLLIGGAIWYYNYDARKIKKK